MGGEMEQVKGAEGARRAKRWLEATTRVSVPWLNPEPNALNKLTFSWMGGGTFSFDLGGHLTGGAKDGESFVAECKAYANHGDQGTEYLKYLAKCYRALQEAPRSCDNFLWITWAPFSVTTWTKLQTPEKVAEAVAQNSARVLGEATVDISDVPAAECEKVAERLWIIVLSKQQEDHLVLLPEHESLIASEIRRRAASG